MKEKKKPKVVKSFQDLRPHATIDCFYCLLPKDSQGSRKFRAHHVCGECVNKLDMLSTEK